MAEWRPVVGLEGRYEVSDDGQVASLGAIRVVLKPQTTDEGYKWVELRGKRRRIHLLVLEAFVGPKPADKEMGAHLDGNPANNAVGNLMWATNIENREHMKSHRTQPNGEGHGAARLTWDQVREMRARYKPGDDVEALGREYGVARRHSYGILEGKYWKEAGFVPWVEVDRRMVKAQCALFCPIHGNVEGDCQTIARLRADLQTADKLVSDVHDLIWKESAGDYDRKAASDLIWAIHEILRPLARPDAPPARGEQG